MGADCAHSRATALGNSSGCVDKIWRPSASWRVGISVAASPSGFAGAVWVWARAEFSPGAALASVDVASGLPPTTSGPSPARDDAEDEPESDVVSSESDMDVCVSSLWEADSGNEEEGRFQRRMLRHDPKDPTKDDN